MDKLNKLFVSVNNLVIKGGAGINHVVEINQLFFDLQNHIKRTDKFIAEVKKSEKKKK
jgi:hypothetical protein